MCCYKLFFIFNLHDSPIHQRREVFAGRGRRRLPCRLFLSELNFFHHLDLLWDVSLSNSESLRSDVRRALPLCTPASARKRSRPTCCSLLSHDPFLQGYTWEKCTNKKHKSKRKKKLKKKNVKQECINFFCWSILFFFVFLFFFHLVKIR